MGVVGWVAAGRGVLVVGAFVDQPVVAVLEIGTEVSVEQLPAAAALLSPLHMLLISARAGL